MTALNLLNTDEKQRLRRLGGLSVAAGVLGGVAASLIGEGFSRLAAGGDGVVGGGGDGGGTAAAFLIAVAGGLIVRRWQRLAACRLTADFLHRFRLMVADRLAGLELHAVESLDRDGVRRCLTADTRLVAESAQALADVLTLAATITFALVYALWLSPVAFWLTAGVGIPGLVGIGLLIVGWQRAGAALVRREAGYAAALNDLVGGIKELKLNADRRADFFARMLTPAAEAVRGARVPVGYRVIAVAVVIDFLILCLGVAAFHALPLLADNGAHTAMRAGVVMLSLPAGFLLRIPAIVNGWSALARLHALTGDIAQREASPYHQAPIVVLEDAGPTAATPTSDQPPAVLRYGMEFNDVYFRYTGADGVPGFAVGPLSFEIETGKIHFIIGGNGAGKSTIIKLASGLYRPLSGHIRVDGVPADERYRRRLSTAVFTDAHVFARPYGHRTADHRRINALLDHYCVGHKTRYENGRFTNVDLSTGHRKRLAMAVARLQDKPLYFFDECAADQDPAFLERFYTEYLPELQAQGKTVVAVTHDVGYFERADHVYRFDKGKLVEEWHARPGSSSP